MSNTELTSIKNVAVQASLEAGKIIRQGFGKTNSIEYKNNNPNDMVTDIDKKAEKRIISIVKEKFSDHSIIAEESGEDLKKSSIQWYIDPIDGTTNFIKKIPTSTTVIGVVKDGIQVVGVVYMPFTNELYWAIKDRGAYKNNQKIAVSSRNDIKKSFACVEWWSRDIKHQKRGLEVFNKIAHTTQKIRYLSSTAWDICRVASGEFDFHICDTTNLDIMAPSLILKEAGGKITDDNGKDINIKSKEIIKVVSSNNLLHEKIIETIR